MTSFRFPKASHARQRMDAKSPWETGALPPSKYPDLELVPARFRNGFPITSPKGAAKGTREGEDRWRVELSVGADAKQDEWAGYCWEFAPVNGENYRKLAIQIGEVASPAEVSIKLERPDSRLQDAVKRFLQAGKIEADLSTFDRIVPEIARLCIVLSAPKGAASPAPITFVFSSAALVHH